MAGVGIAAAIGFVFALTVLNTNNHLERGSDNPELAQRQVETQPGAPSSFFFDQQEPSAAQLKQQDGAIGADSSQQEMAVLQQEATELRPILSSVIAVNGTTGEVISEVMQGSRFALGNPVFIQAHFTNPHETDVMDHTLVMTLARNGSRDEGQPANDTVLEQAANFRGDIGANENVDLEFYWNPDAEGEYALLVFSLTPADLTERNSAEPILSISIHAVSE